MNPASADNTVRWFVLRDLTRSNAKLPAYKLLAGKQFEVFTPLVARLVAQQGRRIRVEVPFIHDLLFVRDTREKLNPIVAKTNTLQYRYLHGGFCEPMTVPDHDMERFIRAVQSSTRTRYYRPEEITPAMYGARVRIVGGTLDGYEGHLLALRGSKFRRLLVELPNFLTAAVEVQPDLIELLPEE